jgi:phosphotransferase system HPr-like phosphotransfer protein
MEVTISHLQGLHVRAAELFGFIDGWRKKQFSALRQPIQLEISDARVA